jgi:hypothetical protein
MELHTDAQHPGFAPARRCDWQSPASQFLTPKATYDAAARHAHADERQQDSRVAARPTDGSPAGAKAAAVPTTAAATVERSIVLMEEQSRAETRNNNDHLFVDGIGNTVGTHEYAGGRVASHATKSLDRARRMGGLISRRSHPPRPDTPPQRTASALTDEPDEPGSPAQSPETVLRERMEAKRLARQKSFKPVPDTITPVRIRDRLARFLEEDFGSPQAMQAAIDVYAAEVDLIEREGRMVGRLVGVSSAGSGAPVNEIRSAIESFLDTPAHAMSHSLDETARLLLQADVDLPGGVLDLTHGSAGPNPRSAVPPFTGQMPRTSASDSAFLKSISTEVQLLEAERRVAEQVAETKHRRQQAQLQHHYIQRLMASKKDGEEIEGVLASAKVIREQKDVLRKWQAEQESLNMLKDELHDWEHKAGKANAALMPLLASHRTLKQALDKFVTDEEENQKVVEECE